MKWISIKKKLPPIRRGVLITDGIAIVTAQLCSVNPLFWIPCGFGGYEYEWDVDRDNVSHWMLLPSPPKRTKK